jgi:hypothetical protein
MKEMRKCAILYRLYDSDENSLTMDPKFWQFIDPWPMIGAALRYPPPAYNLAF